MKPKPPPTTSIPQSALQQVSAPAEGKRAPEKKTNSSSAKHPSAVISHHKALDKISHSSSTPSTVDLQSSVFGRSSSSMSSLTVPIRLDTLSYLLNNVFMGHCRMLPQRPHCGSQCAAMPFCPINPAPVCSSQMGQYTQLSCGCTAHFTPTTCFSQLPAYPGGINTDPSRMLGRPAGCQSDVSCIYPPVIMNQSTGACNTTGGGCDQRRGGNLSMPETKRLLPERYGERQCGSFGSARGTFSKSSECQSAPQEWSFEGSPNRSFGGSPKRGFGGWKENQGRGGHHWSERPPRDGGRFTGRSNSEFNSGSWRRNSRDENRGLQFGEKTWNSEFGNRKRNHEERLWPTEEEQPPKQGLWSNSTEGAKGRGGRPWQQRKGPGNSSVQSDLGAYGDCFKSNSLVPSRGITTSATAKQGFSTEDWEVDYEPGKLPTTGFKATNGLDQKSLDTKPQVADTKQEDWETDYIKEGNRSPLAELKITKNSKDLKEAVITAKEKSDDNPGVFEKYLRGFFSDMIPKGEKNSLPGDVDEGECSDSIEEVDVGEEISSPSSAKVVICSLPPSPLPVAHSKENTEASKDEGECSDSIEEVDVEEEILSPSSTNVVICSPPPSPLPVAHSKENTEASKDEGECSDSIEEVDVGEEISSPSSTKVVICSPPPSPLPVAHIKENTKASKASEPQNECSSETAIQEDSSIIECDTLNDLEEGEEINVEVKNPTEEKDPNNDSDIQDCLKCSEKGELSNS
nr:uncharacterized protein LOC117369425 isoform X2 [Geotrypetes seraphini]XP_033819880.1 uncharacterized protein LOC117369425 isoform X2 [Geotrypetes seraphini]